MTLVVPSATTAPVPPQNLDAEESVLGAMMLSPGAIGAVSEVLSPGDFYRESHAKIYRAALALYAKGEPAGACGSTSWPESFPPPRTQATTRASSARWRRSAA